MCNYKSSLNLYGCSPCEGLLLQRCTDLFSFEVFSRLAGAWNLVEESVFCLWDKGSATEFSLLRVPWTPLVAHVGPSP